MAKRTQKKTVNTTWEVWTYDVWGNAKDGYQVNDRFCQDRAYPLKLEVEACNAGTEREFETACPSDKQLRAVFGVKCKLETDGDDCNIYVNRARDQYPLGELLLTSHASLSPIREHAKQSA